MDRTEYLNQDESRQLTITQQLITQENDISYQAPAEKIVKANAEKMKMPVGRYVRRLAVQSEIKCYDLSIYNNLIYSFNKVGSELNQIAKVANSTGSVYQKDIEDMRKSYKYFTKLMTKHLAPLKIKTTV